MAELKATKSALVTSVISLLLSCAMLFGTTFAWFTDNVESSDNRILAGNLNVDLLMYKSGKYVSIAEGNGDIFREANGGNEVRWEPGKTEVVYLAVKNIGSLALKYEVKFDVEDHGLAGALEYAILDGGKAKSHTVASWDQIKSNQKHILTGKLTSVTKGELNEEEDINYFAVAVHMPDNTLDKYQGKEIIVDLTLMATQSAYEKDSFGDEYDKGAKYDESKLRKNAENMSTVSINTIEEFKEFSEAVNLDNTYKGVSVANNPQVYVKLTGDLDLSEYTDFEGIGDGKDNSFNGVFDGCNYTIKNWKANYQDKPLALFSTTYGVSVKNLTIDNFKIGSYITKGNDYGVLIGRICGGEVLIDKVSVKNSTVTAEKTIGVIVGTMTEGHLTITNCNIEEITIKNAEGFTDAVGVLLGNGYSEKDYEESGFKESKNTINNVKWFSGETEQTSVPAYNYKK